MKTTALLLLVSLAGCTAVPAHDRAVASASSFSAGYIVFVSSDKRECLYSPGHVGYTAAQFEKNFSASAYDRRRGVQFLYAKRPPQRCLDNGAHIIRRLGFAGADFRKATDSDLRPDTF